MYIRRWRGRKSGGIGEEVVVRDMRQINEFHKICEYSAYLQ